MKSPSGNRFSQGQIPDALNPLMAPSIVAALPYALAKISATSYSVARLPGCDLIHVSIEVL